MLKKPWVKGPLELLIHGLEHLQQGDDFNFRIAMITIDNSVELMAKTFLGLPKTTTGTNMPSKAEYSRICSNFPSLLAGLRSFASGIVDSSDLDKVEFYHKIRNELYHKGVGITVEKNSVEDYAGIAEGILCTLFQVTSEEVGLSQSATIETLRENWGNIKKELARIGGAKFSLQTGLGFDPTDGLIKNLQDEGLVDSGFATKLSDLRGFMNRLKSEIYRDQDRAMSIQDTVQHNKAAKRILRILKTIDIAQRTFWNDSPGLLVVDHPEVDWALDAGQGNVWRLSGFASIRSEPGTSSVKFRMGISDTGLPADVRWLDNVWCSSDKIGENAQEGKYNGHRYLHIMAQFNSSGRDRPELTSVSIETEEHQNYTVAHFRPFGARNNPKIVVEDGVARLQPK